MPQKQPNKRPIAGQQPDNKLQPISPLALPKKPKPVQIDLTHGPDLSDLDTLSGVTQADIVHAQALWNSKTNLPGLLSAKVEEEE